MGVANGIFYCNGTLLRINVQKNPLVLVKSPATPEPPRNDMQKTTLEEHLKVIV